MTSEISLQECFSNLAQHNKNETRELNYNFAPLKYWYNYSNCINQLL